MTVKIEFFGSAEEVLHDMKAILRSQDLKIEWKIVGDKIPTDKQPVVDTGGDAYKAAAEVLYGTTAVEEKVAPTEEPKRKRRTKAEIEAEKAANITATPEHRVDPEVEAQDAADEAAETEQTDDAPKVFSRDDVRSRMTTLLGLMPGNEAEKYQKFAALATPIFNAVLGTPPDGENWRIGLIADNADHFALLCEGFDIAIRGASNG